MKLIPDSFLISLLIVPAIGLTSCSHKNNRTVSHEINIHIDRFEEDLFSIDLYHLSDSIPYLQKKYPDFFPLFTYQVISIGGPDEPEFPNRLLAFVSDFTNYRVSKRVKEIFPDMSLYEHELSAAFSGFKAVFPEMPIPRIITCITGFNQSVITADSVLAISLDKYLGSDDEFYNLIYPPVPEYLRRIMRPEKIPSDVLQAWIMTNFDYNTERNDLLSAMIYNGRAIYCVKQLIPEAPDTLLWGFTNKQLTFCENNEREMWEYLVEYKKLFITDQFILNQFINPAPFTKDFRQDSPGRAVVWMGYRIVDSYMKHNREITLQELMKETDCQKILNLSKYNP